MNKLKVINIFFSGENYCYLFLDYTITRNVMDDSILCTKLLLLQDFISLLHLILLQSTYILSQNLSKYSSKIYI